jgi:hypothetical protein
MAMRIRAELMARRKCSLLMPTAVLLIATLCLRLTDAARGDDDARTRVSILQLFFFPFDRCVLTRAQACTGGFHSGPRCLAFIRHLGTDAFEFLSSLGHRAQYLCHMISCAARSECTCSESDSVRHRVRDITFYFKMHHRMHHALIMQLHDVQCNSHRSRAGTTTTTRASHPVQHAVMLTAHDSVHHTCSKVNLIKFEISTACMHTRSHHTAACAARASCMLPSEGDMHRATSWSCDSHQISQCSCAAMHVHSACYIVCTD